MSNVVKKVFLLEGLDCANCAAKIENAVQNIAGVKHAIVDFVSMKMILEIEDNDNLQNIIIHAKKIAQEIEDGLKIVDFEEQTLEKSYEDTFDKVKIIKISIGTIIFFVALLFHFPFWISFALYFTSYIIIGGEVVLKAFKNIIKGQVFDENFLMTIATFGAFAIKEFPEGVAVMLFYQVGESFQDLAVNRSRRSIGALMDIRPDFANLKIKNEIKKVSPYDVRVGDIIVVKPGEKIPLDGVVIEGNSFIDTQALTGESMPREAMVGSAILSGTINKNGVLTIKVSKEFGESTVSKILDLVQNASNKKAPTEKFITKFARYYTPVVVVIALVLATVPPLIIPSASFSDWIYRALVFLVVSCPCALVVSIPLGFFGGIGGASRNGILIKGSNYLEALNNIDTVVFDKTGTLTKGVFRVTQINSHNNFEKDEVLKYAAMVESFSSHPIAQSILIAYGKDISGNDIPGNDISGNDILGNDIPGNDILGNDISGKDISKYDEIPGEGIKASINGRDIVVGNSKLLIRENIDFALVETVDTIIYVAIDGIYAGNIVISDEVKIDSQRTIIELKKLGIKKIAMLTGDNKSVGEKVAKQLGIALVYTDLLPHQKLELLEMLDTKKSTNGILVFVGDGINDAPVLARADVGVAMGGLGSDAAIEAADVVLMTDEPSKLVSAIRIARITRNIVYQNIIFAFAVKILVLALGASGIATLWEAVFADVGVTLIAVLNAMRVLKTKDLSNSFVVNNATSTEFVDEHV